MSSSNDAKPAGPALFWRLSAIFILVLTRQLPAADAPLKTLPRHVPDAVRRLSARGNLPPTNRLNLAIGLPARDARGLDDFVAQISDPASPNYRRYLTPEQFTARFGPTEADYADVTAFARRNHFTVTTTHANRLLLDVSGSVADIQKAFHITLRAYAHPSEARDFYAPDSEPMVESSLPVADISGLNNYVLPHPKSLHTGSSSSSQAIQKTGTGSASGGSYMGKDFRAAYLPGVTLTGSGQIVGLVEFDGYYASDISAYETAAGYPSVTLQNVLLDSYNGTPRSVNGNEEVSLDIEVALALAPGLSEIVVFEAGPSGLPNEVVGYFDKKSQ